MFSLGRWRKVLIMQRANIYDIMMRFFEYNNYMLTSNKLVAEPPPTVPTWEQRWKKSAKHIVKFFPLSNSLSNKNFSHKKVHLLLTSNFEFMYYSFILFSAKNIFISGRYFLCQLNLYFEDSVADFYVPVPDYLR